MRKEKKRSPLSRLLEYAGNYRKLTFLGLFLSAIAMIAGMIPYVCIWLVLKELIKAALDFASASEISVYGWIAFAAAVGGILIYFAALMCTHLAAFKTASNIRKRGMEHLMKAPLGFFDSHASGLLRNRLDNATASLDVENETKVQGALSGLLKNKTVLVIAHRMRTVEAADKVVVLKDGRVAEEGSPAELKVSPGSIFSRMLTLQTEGAGWSI